MMLRNKPYYIKEDVWYVIMFIIHIDGYRGCLYGMYENKHDIPDYLHMEKIAKKYNMTLFQGHIINMYWIASIY